MQSKYEVPSSLKELFANGENSYRIINYEKGMDMDNVVALNHFLETVQIPSEAIDLNDGTQVFLKHPDFDYLAVVDSYGLGDFFSHGFDVSFVKLEGDSYVPYSPK